MNSIAEARTAFPSIDSLDVDLLICHILQCNRSHVIAHPESKLSQPQAHQFENLAARRNAGEPLAYLLGEKEFWDISLCVNPQVLIPRPETELLVELCQELIPKGASVLELGTGSGAIALALANDYSLTAIDNSEKALNVARCNADKLSRSVQFLVSDWYSNVSGDFDAIVSNPPYIAATDECLKNLTFEPLSALAAGIDGLDCLTAIIESAGPSLRPCGFLLLEHGNTQSEAVASLMKTAGFMDVKQHQDLAGHNRVTSGTKPPTTPICGTSL